MNITSEDFTFINSMINTASDNIHNGESDRSIGALILMLRRLSEIVKQQQAEIETLKMRIAPVIP